MTLELGRKVKELRGRRRQAEVAQAAGIGPQRLSDIENGKARDVKLSTLQALAQVLGCTVVDLIAETPPSEAA